jgi:nucleotide-binding universal stress UspA family protein
MSSSPDTSTRPSEDDQPQTGMIVVGVSAGTGSEAALRWAAEDARRRQGRVRAVMAWRPSGLPGGAPGRLPPQTIADLDQQELAEEKLREFVDAALGEGHEVECRAVEGAARTVLLEAARGAELLVLDSPRMSKLTDPRARRLASRLIYRSPCPVVMMPPPAHAPSPKAQDAAADLEQSAVKAG